MGDLNADLMKDISAANFGLGIGSELSLQIAQHDPTHHTKRENRCFPTWTDMILVDSNDNILDAQNNAAPYHIRQILL